METEIDKIDKDEATRVATKMLKTCVDFKQPRMAEIREIEDMLAYKLKPALAGRLNVPFDGVVMNGFIDTLTAQENKNHRLAFTDPRGSNLKAARKITAAYEMDSSSTKGRWKSKIRASKRLAAISGRGIFKVYSESSPVYRSCLENVDIFDFVFEPQGGGHLEDHLFNGQENVFRSISDLELGVKSGYYDAEQVKKLTAAYSASDFKFNEDLYRNKIQRLAGHGLDAESNNYVGSQLFNLTEFQMTYMGRRWYLLFDYKSGIWLRFEPNKSVFGSDLYQWVSWAAPQSDPFNFLNKGPADSMRPIAEAIRINLNEILNNNRKRNWDMKAVDKNMFTDLSQLDFRQDGLAIADLKGSQKIQDGIYHFQTPEISGAINLNEYLDNFGGINSGVNKQTKGLASEDKVGIAEINELSISKRTKLITDSFKDCLAEIGLRYDWGLHEHLPEKHMVKLIGITGVEWDEIRKEDTDPDFECEVIADDDVIEKQAKSEKRSSFLKSIINIPLLISQYNPKVLAEELAIDAGYEPERLQRLMDTKNEATDEIIAEANKAIELIVEGKEARVNRNATTGFLARIDNFLLDTDDLTAEVRAKIEAYFQLHVPIAAENKRRAMMAQLDAEPGAPAEGTPVVPGAQPVVPADQPTQ